jgi:hypothetical protein
MRSPSQVERQIVRKIAQQQRAADVYACTHARKAARRERERQCQCQCWVRYQVSVETCTLCGRLADGRSIGQRSYMQGETQCARESSSRPNAG